LKNLDFPTYTCLVKSNLEVNQIVSISQQAMAREVFDQTWLINESTEITSNLLQAMVHTGSYLSGAYIENKLVGAAFAFPATNGGLHLHSHMTAVLEEYRDQGVGYALKIDQWHWAKKNNFSEISWTFDPLVSRNAKLNLIKLGVNISSYHPNFYGDMPDALNAGDESDRLMVSWKVIGENPVQRELVSTPKPNDILIQIPADIVAIRSSDKIENLRWRRKVREQFLQVLEKGGQVVGFSTNSEYVVRI
jgi:predicted GNAT superfamily acetyltransferase